MDFTGESIQETSYVDSEIRIVILGKTGSGKSTLGNLLVGEKVFESNPFLWSCTENCQQAMFEYKGQAIQIVDTPGFSDTRREEKCLNTELHKCLELTSPGIHAVLYTIRIGRFTKEDKDVLDKFLGMFGKNIIDHVIIIFTGKDDLDRCGVSFEDMKGDEKFDSGLQKILDDCKERYMVLCACEEDSRDEYMQEILTKTKQLTEANGRRYYTNEMFLAAEVELLKLEKQKMNELTAKNKEQHEKDIKELETRLRKEMEEMELSRDEVEKKIKDEKLKVEKAYELEMKTRSRRELREGIIKGLTRSTLWMIGAVVGNESFQIAGTALGGAVAGPVGATVGSAAGALLGTFVGGYFGSKTGNAIVPDSTVPANSRVTEPDQTSGDQTDNDNVNRVVP